jgi:U3 small nucleolar RNA-associated protein 10
MISFWSSITMEAVFGILENTSTGRREIQSQKTEELVYRVLEPLRSCMRAKFGAETVAACYTIVTVLAGRGELGDKLLDGLMEAVVLAYDAESLTACLQCLAVIAEQRSLAQLPDRVSRRLLAIPQLSEKLIVISKECRVHRLTLGCALGALARIERSDEQRDIFQELMASGLLTESCTRSALSALVSSLRDVTAGSSEHGRLLELVGQLAETTFFLDIMRAAAKADEVDLESLGLAIGTSLEPVQHEDGNDDEDMLDIDDAPMTEALEVEAPTISTQSFLSANASESFSEVADAFQQAAGVAQTTRFLDSPQLQKENAMQKSLYLSFLIRLWSSARLPSARATAIRAAARTVKAAEASHDLQNLLPYLIHALADSSPIVRRAAAACIVALSENQGSKTKSVWGVADMYGKAGKASKDIGKITELKSEEALNFLSSVLVPMLEESIMDSSFVIPALQEVLEGSKNTKTHGKATLNAQTRGSIISFLASHVSVTPLVRVRHVLLPIFNFSGKVSDTVRGNVILPLVRSWCLVPSAEASKVCDAEEVTLGDFYRGHLNALIAKEAKSVQLLDELVTESLQSEWAVLANAVFDQITLFWPKMKSESRLSLARTLLDVSFQEGKSESEKLCRERAIEILRNVKHDSATLVTFLDSVPAALEMPEGPPTKKRRRTSRNEMARVELSSQDDVNRLLRKLTLVLELIEGSNPGQHPALFRSLFTIFGDLQPLKQQSGNELVYLQSMILGSLTPIVDALKVSAFGTLTVTYVNSFSNKRIRQSTSPRSAPIYSSTASAILPARKCRIARCC